MTRTRKTRGCRVCTADRRFYGTVVSVQRIAVLVQYDSGVVRHERPSDLIILTYPGSAL